MNFFHNFTPFRLPNVYRGLGVSYLMGHNQARYAKRGKNERADNKARGRLPYCSTLSGQHGSHGRCLWLFVRSIVDEQ